MAQKKKYFGTDGIRGRFDVHPMTADFAKVFGAATVDWLVQGGWSGSGRPTVLIGRDTRVSGTILEAAFAEGANLMGADVHFVGVIPTPGVAWLTVEEKGAVGVVISASHNPYHDNGIKLFGADGFKLADTQELAIEAKIDQFLEAGIPAVAESGETTEDQQAHYRYLEHLKGLWPATLSLEGKTLVVDGAHGAAYELGPMLFEALGATVHAIGVKPNGVNINEGSGALDPSGLQQAVLTHGAMAGLAFDGDADRLIVVDEKGQVVDGDQIMCICGPRLSNEDGSGADRVVATVMSNMGLELALKEHGLLLDRTAVGDKYVMERMRETQALLGGEQSGHLIFLQHATTGDGLLAALKLMQFVMESGEALSALAGEMSRFPQILRNVMIREKAPWREIPSILAAVEEAEAELHGEGRVFVRYSGTENKARVMVEGKDQQQLESLVERVAAVFEQELGLHS
jgi:phosphoglucosamine mutase